MNTDLFSEVFNCLMVERPAEKVVMSQALYQRWRQEPFIIQSDTAPQPIPVAGRPEKPELVSPRQVPKRSMNTEDGRVILAHAIAHIEFNAINLALDAVYRFRDMPKDYYSDWLQVASEEAYHFSLVEAYLKNHGHQYGDYRAHNGLWEMALKTSDDVMVRMALVPRVLEARGLDVTPGMIDKLEKVGDKELVDILRIIHREEIGHVAIGSRWFRYACEQRGVEPRVTFKALLKLHMKGAIRGPFDELTRKQAGFSDEEMDDLKSFEIGL